MDGTSMAAPHAAGSVALLRSFAPGITGKMALLALYYSATDLGDAGEDNTYGMGMIDVFAAMKILGVSITHTPLSDTINTTGPYKVRIALSNSIVVDAKPNPSKVKLFWSRNSASISDSILMTKDTGNVYFANIPGNGIASNYKYFIRVFDTLNVRSQMPADAPFSYLSFNTGVSKIETKPELIPDDYYLAQNYPNPFNPVTTIKFGIKETGNVKLTIYDVSGKEVKSLLNEVLEAGTYNMVFDAGNDGSSALSSGIYFYKLESGSFSKTMKMILLK